MPPAQGSTRLNVAQTLLDEVRARLAGLPPSPEADDLRSQALECEFDIGGWALAPPSVEEREAIIRRVLGLQAAAATLIRRSIIPP